MALAHWFPLFLALAAAHASPAALTKHLVNSGEPHCDQITVSLPDSDWWKSNQWRYASWADGACPARFNFLNQEEKLDAVAVQSSRGVTVYPALGGVPTIQIAPGVHLPMAGLGTWQYNSSRTEAAVLAALEVGYVAIDTAHDYSNQDGVGRALKRSGRERSAYFVTTKLEGGLGYAETIKTHEENLKLLGLKYVDLLLVHFPTTMAPPIVGNATARQEQWRAMEALVGAGKARAIGTSHFCKRQMQDVLKVAKVCNHDNKEHQPDLLNQSSLHCPALGELRTGST